MCSVLILLLLFVVYFYTLCSDQIQVIYITLKSIVKIYLLRTEWLPRVRSPFHSVLIWAVWTDPRLLLHLLWGSISWADACAENGSGTGWHSADLGLRPRPPSTSSQHQQVSLSHCHWERGNVGGNIGRRRNWLLLKVVISLIGGSQVGTSSQSHCGSQVKPA